ncbi:MAG: dTDP-4-dehydrorhamnose reductase [Candidatus Margulisbacteria bacterium]|nr:dTDP-4-dehydrorhamnose reductase [Candidatus Margulisiibacteriota bacterium]
MKIAVIGAKGMLAAALIPLLKKHELKLGDLPEIDITNKEQVDNYLQNIEFVFHCAAITDVDGAEKNPERTFAVNVEGTKNIAKTCAKLDIPLVYISTDYVFSGNSHRHPWVEDDLPAPQGVYANSKFEGERAVIDNCQKYFIVRTAWLYGPNGKNFVDTILNLAKNQKEIKVVNDQLGSPTYSRHLAEALVKFLDIKEYGVYHLTNQGEVSWYFFARKILELAGTNVKILPCKTEEFPRSAPRPAYSVLNNKHWAKLGQKLLPGWEEGLKAYLREIKR